MRPWVQGDNLRKAKEYRDNADECRAIAKGTADPFTRMSFLKVAEVWDELAEQRTNSAKRRKDQNSG